MYANSSIEEARLPLKGQPAAVHFSIDAYRGRSDSSGNSSLQQTATPDPSLADSGNEVSYFEDDVKRRVCWVSRTVSWIVVAVFIVLVVGGVVGSVTAVELKKPRDTARYCTDIVPDGIRIAD